MHKIDTGQTLSSLCNHLYLTAPGQLWSNHTNNTPVQPHPNDYAIHVPTQHTTAHIYYTWSIWMGECEHNQDQMMTSTERMQHLHSNEAYGSSKTDRVLDEYVKTVPASIDKSSNKIQYTTSTESHTQSLVHTQSVLNKRETERTDATTPSLKTSPRTQSQNPAPSHHQKTVRQWKKNVQHSQTTRTKSWSRPPLKPVAHHFTSLPYPHRIKAVQRSDDTPDVLKRATSSHPWNVASCTMEQIELLLESCIPLTMKSNDYKKTTNEVRRFVRELLTRGSLLQDWYADLQDYECDMYDITPGSVQLARRQAYHYMTPQRLVSSLYTYLNRFAVDEREIHFMLMLDDLRRPGWWHRNYHNDNNVSMNLTHMHQLAQHFTETHNSEPARETMIRKILPPTFHQDQIRRYAQRYEHLVRVRLMSDTAFRKDDAVLSVFYTLHLLPTPKQTHKLQTEVVHHTKHSSVKTKTVIPQNEENEKGSKTVSRRMKTLHLSLNASDRVPQSINVKVKRNATKPSVAPSTPQKRKIKMTTTKTKTKTIATPAKNTNTAITDTNKQKKHNKNNKSQGGTKNNTPNKADKTITINTQLSNTKAQSCGGTEMLNISKTSSKTVPSLGRGRARYLTSDEVDAYRSGLKRHIEQNGGGSFVLTEQQKQDKKTPGFCFDHIVDNQHQHYDSIKNKLQLSAKNRNALRRVKRDVLKSFGSNRTFKNLKKTKDNNKKPNKSNGFVGSLYTRKSAGGGSENISDNSAIPRVSWKEKDSLGSTLRDESTNDLKATDGLSNIDLSSLEEVVID